MRRVRGLEERFEIGLYFRVFDKMIVLIDDDFGGEIFFSIHFDFFFEH